jgi:predicted ATP-grasp superfamily ATP-dependent carboligase
VSPIRITRRPSLRDPILICGFRGWNDGGEASSSAVAYLRDRWGAEQFADIDPEDYYDFQVTRPTVRLEAGVTRRIDWPENRFWHTSVDGRDAVLFLGIEPNTRWRTFTDEIVGLARDLGVGSTVTLGAFLADIPHSADAPVTGSAGDERKAEELGLTSSRYEGPTGIVGVLHDAFSKAGLPSASLWAAVPHYLPGGPNPKAALALVRKISAYARLPVETDTLERAATAWETQVTSSISDNPELAAYVRQLEEVAADREGLPEIPTGETLAEELERFLKQQRGEPS